MSFDFNLKSEEVLAANMATPHLDAILGSLLPDRFKLGDNVEHFIKKCNRYFEAGKIPKHVQYAIVLARLDDCLVEQFEATDAKMSYEDRLRKAFGQKKSFAQDWMEALSFRRKADPADVYFKKVDKMVENILSHNITKEELTAFFLVHCADDVELEKEIKMRDIEEVDQIKKTVKKLDEVRHKEREVNTVATGEWTTIVRGQPKPRASERKVDNRTCYNCQKSGHIARNCKSEKVVTCYACHRVGHIARNCTNVIKCRRCQYRGHHESECYTNLERRGQQRSNYKQGTSTIQRRFEHKQGNNRINESRQYFKGQNHRMVNRYNRQVAAFEQESDSEYNEEHPKENAPTPGECVGAIH